MSTSTDRPAPAADYGFFGPGSIAWQVWSYPTSILLGFFRAVTVEELDPFLVASVEQSGQVRQRTPLRYDRTMQYFATVMFGDAQSVLKAADILVKIHSRAVGVEPITGRRFDANDPDSQLWIHLTAWHSILYCYEVYGPGKLGTADEAQFWAACAVAAEFQTIDPADVPADRAGVRRYFAECRPKLVGSEVAQDMMDFLLGATGEVLPRSLPRPVNRVITAVVRRSIIATMPRWMRRMGGTPQSRVIDAVCRPVMRTALRLLALRPEAELATMTAMSPRTAPVIAPVLAGVPAVNPVTYTPTEARAVFGMPETPREQYARLLAEREIDGTDAVAGTGPYGHNHEEQPLEFSRTA